MKVILVQDIANLGTLGDQIQVKDGYARNFLIPQGKAILASSKKSKELQHRMQFFEKLRQAAIENANGEAAKLITVKFQIQKKAGPGGRLFGSVTNTEITTLIQEHGFEVTRRHVIPYEPIKTIGTHKVSVKLHSEVKVDINVTVISDLVASEPSAGEAEQVPQDQVGSEETVEASPETSADSEETVEASPETSS